MTGTAPSARRRNRNAVIGIMVAIGFGIALPFQGSNYAVVVGDAILVACALVVLVWLYAAVRRGIRVHRGDPLQAVSRGSERVGAVPAELRRIQSDIARARESARQYGKSLGPRLAHLADRRGGLAGGRTISADVVPREAAPRRAGRRGMSASEISRIIESIEEL